ncbi:MAG TPA: DUF2079 domain-containing protein, partial [Candidatus Polarisedimenticolia bacterium]|nr:DUF2079 domain-containing protein [Candidatus Polarisedimenticolia bacterium]
RATAQYRPLSYLVGDCPYYAATAVSLLYDHDLDLRNQLRGGLEVHGRQIALGRGGEWFPKHPILMPIVSVPFLLTFGMPGLLLFNVLVLGLLALALMGLARPFASPAASALAAFLALTGTFLRRYGYNFSPDLFATLILVLALRALIRGRDLWGGALLGLSVTAKLTHLFLIPFGLLYAFWRRGRRAGMQATASAAVPLLFLGLLNLAHFGSPLVTSYDRNVAIEDGGIVTMSHRGLFDQNPIAGFVSEMIDPRHGLLPTSPALLLALPGFVLLFRRRPAETVLFLALAEFLVLFFGTYRYWSTSHYGNRFLMPVIAVAVPALALTLDWSHERLRARRRRPGPAPGAAEAAP